MNASSRPLALAGIAVAIAGVAIYLTVWGSGGQPAPQPAPTDTEVAVPATEDSGLTGEPTDAPALPARHATGAEAATLAVESDPVIRAAMSGFRGRVLDHRHQPLPELRVELLRFALDTVLKIGEQENGSFDPELVAGETTTDTAGEFTITGVWPQAFYALLAGAEGESPKLIIVDQTPGPGEIVDLGDITLDPTATILGTVVDDDGVPLAGAVVRAIDLPAMITAAVPIERFHPSGVIIVSDEHQTMVIEFPRWLVQRFDRLPIPRATSAADGHFTLRGVPAGNTMVAVTSAQRQSAVLPRVRLKAGDEKDVGSIVLKLGEEVWGKVVDDRGQPIAGAQVAVGQTGGMAPIAFGEYAEPTDRDGGFAMTGLRSGRVLAAARRDAGEPWVVSEPTVVGQQVLLQLPSLSQLTLVVLHDGEPVDDVTLSMFAAEEPEMAMMGRFGFGHRVDLEGRMEPLGEGRQRIAGLSAGKYQLTVSSPGFADAQLDLELRGNIERTVALSPASHGIVQVKTEDDKPVRNAAVYVTDEGEEMPRACGRTTATGRLELRRVLAGTRKVAAYHPAYGWASKEITFPTDKAKIVMRAPGSLEGTLTDAGEAPEFGKWMVVVAPNGDSEGVAMPQLAAPDGEGRFHVRGLQPSTYWVGAVPSVRAVRSLGSIFKLMQASMWAGETANVEVEVRSGATANAVLAVNRGEEQVDGPSAAVRGTVAINGRPAVDMMVATWSSGRRSARVDETGRFDLGRVEAGNATIQLFDTSEAKGMFGDAMWQRTYEIEADRDLDITIDLVMSAVRGSVTGENGTPAVRCRVSLRGTPQAVADEDATVRLSTISDDGGAFHFEQVPAGTYSLEVEDKNGRGHANDIRVIAGSPTVGVNIRLEQVFSVAGRLDISSLGEPPPDWVWVEFSSEESSGPSDSSGVRDGVFHVEGLTPGRYRVEISGSFPANGERETRTFVHNGGVEITHGDVTGLVLRPVPVTEKQR